MAFDTKAWLTDLKFSEDEIKDLLPRFETRSTDLEKGQLRQSEFSRLMNSEQAKLAKAQDDLSAKESKLNSDMAEWASMTAAEQAQHGELKVRIDASEEKVFKLQQKIVRLAEDAGIDPKTVLEGEVTPPKKEDPKPVDLDPLRQQIGGLADYMLTLNAELPAIAQEHFELTGERLDTRAFIASIKNDLKTGKATAEQLDPVRRWETQYGIPAKRTEKSATQRKAELDAAREEGRMAALTESSLPNTRPVTGTHSPLLRSAIPKDGGSKLSRPQPSQRMAGAIAALATGKYRSQSGAGKT
jgi:hypothetical protein